MEKRGERTGEGRCALVRMGREVASQQVDKSPSPAYAKAMAGKP
jgi:hypothetical protein